MKYAMQYVYPALFAQKKEGGYAIEFPDFPWLHAKGKTWTTAFAAAEEALNRWLWHAEEEGKTLPRPTNPAAITPAADAFISLIKADTWEYRKKHDTRTIDRMITLPKWLDTMGQERAINYSMLLQSTLMEMFHHNH